MRIIRRDKSTSFYNVKSVNDIDKLLDYIKSNNMRLNNDDIDLFNRLKTMTDNKGRITLGQLN